jgi:hypothetical protein
MLNDKCQNEKAPSLFPQDLGLVEQTITFGSRSSESKVPFANNNYARSNHHKTCSVLFYASIFVISQQIITLDK